MSAQLAGRVMEANARAYRRTWKGTVVTAFLQPILFLLGMGLGLGEVVRRPAEIAELGGLSYVAFLAPGLLAAAAMQTGESEGSWPIMAGIKWRKSFFAWLATPVDIASLVSGTIAWIAVRVLLTCIVFVVVMAAVGATSLGRGLMALPAALLTGAAFGAMMTAYTPLAKDETRLTSVYRFVLIPMFLFSGTFFPVDQLPDWLEPLAYVTPLWHGVELCRALALGTQMPISPLISVAYLGSLTALGWWLARRTFAKRLRV